MVEPRPSQCFDEAGALVPNKGVQRVPKGRAQAGERLLSRYPVSSPRLQDDSPVSG
jgi:hypothetical protein